MRPLRGYYVSCRNPLTKQENAFINLGCIFVAIRDRLGSFRLLTHPVDPTHPQTWDAMVLAALGQSCGSSGSVFLCVWKALGCAWKAREGSIRRILCVWKALGGSLCRILRVWKDLGGSIFRILRVWKALGGSICRILRVWKGQILTNLSGPKPS